MTKNEAKPLIEEHYHIQELIENQTKRANEREYYRQQSKNKALRGELIADSKDIEIKEFYCRTCKQDFPSLAHKQVEVDWSNTDQHIAFFKTKHSCGTWCIRYITDRLDDPYWMESPKVYRDRGEHYQDLIQPFENGYNLLYGRQ